MYEGTLDGSRVRIQRVRTYPGGDPRKLKEVRSRRHVSPIPGRQQNPKAFHQVVVVWKHLSHQSIVPLLGVTIDPPQLVSDWMYGGDLTEYITSRPNADRLSLVRVPPLDCTMRSPVYQLSDVAEGLNYLHSCNVIHGDLKGVSDFHDLVSPPH